MNGNRIMSDTNPLIYLLSGNEQVANILEEKYIYVSVITELELFGKQNLTDADTRIIETLLDNCFVIELNHEIKLLYRDIRKRYHIRLPDAIVAATALYLDMPLLTYDQGFSRIPELKLILPEL